MSNSIQFKKLVWEQYGLSLLRWNCINAIAEFSIETHTKYILYINAKSAGIHKRKEFKTPEKAKQYAQEWFEQQLTQFIETSENPAQ